MESRLRREGERYPIIVSFVGIDEYDFFRIGANAMLRLGYPIGFGAAHTIRGDTVEPTITTDSEESKAQILALMESTLSCTPTESNNPAGSLALNNPTGALISLIDSAMVHRFYFALSGIKALEDLLGIDYKILDLPGEVLERGFATAIIRSNQRRPEIPIDFVPGEREYYERIKKTREPFSVEELTSMVTAEMTRQLTIHP